MIMNKILYTLLLIFCIGITACDNDDSIVEIASLDIIEATVDFDAIGGEGFITLGDNKNVDVKVSSSAEWCSIKSATNDKVTFAVTPNEGITTRAATIKITIPGEEKLVSITQIGVVSQYDSDGFYAFPDNASFNKKINFVSTLPITVSIEDAAKSWLSYKDTEGGYIFTAGANDTGNARIGKITIASGHASIDYHFLQYGLDDLCGTWNATYSTGEELAKDEILITKTADGLNINMKGLGYSNIEAVYQDGSIRIPCVQFMGVASQYYLFLGAYDSRGQAVLDENTTCQLTPYLAGDKQWGLAFVDNGSWQYGLSAIAVWAVVPSTGAVAGYWDIMYNLSLNK